MATEPSSSLGGRRTSGASPSGARARVEYTGADKWLVTHETVVSELVPLPGSAEEDAGDKAPARKPHHGRSPHRPSAS